MDQNNQDNAAGQGGIDQETERRNQENETGQQSQQTPQGGQQQPEFGQQADYGSAEQADAPTGQSQGGQSPSEQSEGGSGSGFVGTGTDQSSDYLTKGENQDFAPEGQGASDSEAGTSDIETGQSTNIDATLDDGADSNQ